MTHEFAVHHEIDLDATPDEVWEAIATGPGVDAWFMGNSEFEQRAGGRGSFSMGGETMGSTITAWEPGKQFAYRSDESPDGTFMAFEYLIEARGGGSTALRFAHSGLLGDDWEEEYDALKRGDLMYLRQLAAYLKHFRGMRVTREVFAVGPRVPDAQRVWSAFGTALGVTGPLVEGAPVRLSIGAPDRVEGVVEFAEPGAYLGVRTDSGLYLLQRGYRDTVVVQYHGYADGPGEDEIRDDWQSWLGTAFA